MNLNERYANFSDERLVEIVESPVGDYTSEAIEAAQLELSNRPLGMESLRSLSRKILHARIEEYLEGFDVVNDTLTLPQSRVLNEEEVKAVFKTVFAHWKNEKDDMIPDSWKYVIAAGFG